MKLALDLNSFFASCEQQDRPELRGKPIAVVPLMAETTSCIAASHEAKKFGVKTGTKVAEARRLCPGITMVEATPPRYLDYHHRINAVVDRIVPIEAATSIDEVICDLPAGHKTVAKATALAQQIKAALAAEVGECLTCSIGIAPNAWLAKTASDMQKPNGLVVIEPKDLPHILWGLSLRDLCGIGPNMEARLKAQGFTTVRQLTEATKLQLRRAWGGVEGETMWHRLRGDPVPLTHTEQRSISHSHVLSPHQRNPVDAHAVLHRMMQKAATRLRREGLVTGRMTLLLRVIGSRTQRGAPLDWQEDARFTATDDTLLLTHHLDALWNRPRSLPRGSTLLQVGVVFSELVAAAHQTIPILPEEQSHTKLMTAVDQLNQKFGKNTLYFGAAHKGKGDAPMRIAFTRIPDASE